MFDKLKSFFGRKQPPATEAWSKPGTGTQVAWQRPQNNATSAKPNLAGARAQGNQTADRNQSAQLRPRSDTPAQETRNRSAAVAPQANKRAIKRSTIQHKHADRVDSKQFMNAVTAGNTRSLNAAKTKNQTLKTQTKDRVADSITMRHRSGSITELHLDANSSAVKEAFHKSATTGDQLHLRNRELRGSAKKDLNKFAHRKDKR